VTASSGGEFARLSAVVTRQRQELDRMRSAAAARSVVDLARGMLMERLSCSPAQAQAQLSRLSADSGTSLVELAAQITGPLTATAGRPAELAGAQAPGPPGRPGDAPAEAARITLAGAATETACDGDGLAAAVLEEALAPAGAVALALWRTEPDGGLELAGQAGFAARDVSRWRRIHPDMDTPAQQAAGQGVPTWWPAGRPAGGGPPVMGGWPRGARAVVPLPGPGAALGALEVCWPGPRAGFAEADQRQLSALAEVCAQALGTRLASGDLAPDHRASWAFGLLDSLLGSAIFAKAIRDEAGQLTDFQISYLSRGFTDPAGRGRAELVGRPLLEVYPSTALTGGLYERARQVLASGEAQYTSGEVMSTPRSASPASPVLEVRIARLYDGVVITWRRADEIERLGSLLEQAQRLGRIGGWEENLLTGDVLWTEPTFALFGQPPTQPVPVAKLESHVPADDRPLVASFRRALLQEKREAAAAFRIIRADDESVRQMRAFAEPITDQAGTLVAVRGAYQDVSADYHTQVAFAATRDRLADTEERAAEEHRLALRLQQAITPRTADPVRIAGLEVAARYRPAGPGNLVSGDWYDTVPLPSQEVFLAVGDIAGHGIDAVTGMVTMRNCLRGLAITGAGPGVLLGWLNEVACHLTDGIIGTVVCGIYDPRCRTLRYARAGHLPPLLVRDGTARQLPLPDGVLAGADPGARYQEMTVSLQPADALVLFTDGLVERHDESIDDSLRSLLAIASRPVCSIGGYADHLLASARSDTSDDACLVAVQVS
jgi:serine phosphatase RsbU (regulator of sigma subunit)